MRWWYMAKEKVDCRTPLTDEAPRSVDDMLAELENEHGPVPPQTLEWAGDVVDAWTKRTRRKKAG